MVSMKRFMVSIDYLGHRALFEQKSELIKLKRLPLGHSNLSLRRLLYSLSRYQELGRSALL